MAAAGAFSLITSEADRGSRLDAFLALHLADLSRSHAAQLTREGRVHVNGKAAKPSHRLKPGERVTGTIPPPQAISCLPEPIQLDIIHEDPALLVVNKPPGLVVHPAPGHPSGTLVQGLLYHCPDLPGIGGKARPGIIHRLDKDTSGLLVIAKTDRAHWSLSRQFKEREVAKQYLALVYGHMDTPSGRITLPIGRHPVDRKRMAARDGRGRPAETLWMEKERYADVSLLSVDLKTGRTHQIRVHLAAVHHPVVGDPVYAKPPAHYLKPSSPTLPLVKGTRRQMLHAFRLSFSHPETEKKMAFEAPLPRDMEELLHSLKKNRS